MSYTTLISTEVLAARLSDPNVAVVDCRYKLDDETWGRRQYAARHIPGAVYASLGHDAVAVLDGGFAKWTAEGRAMASGGETRAPREFVASPRSEMAVDAARVSSSLKTGESTLVDARAPERYRGETEPIDKLPGHIPGAANHFFQWNLDEHGMFRTPEELRDRLQRSIGDVPPDRLVCYCGSGVTACHNLLALEHAGLKGAKLYPGSWSEWSSDPARPVERG